MWEPSQAGVVEQAGDIQSASDQGIGVPLRALEEFEGLGV